MAEPKKKGKADKLIIVDTPTHKKLRIRAAQEGTTIGNIVKQLADGPKVEKVKSTAY